jgi:hypothetical protein
MAHCLHFKPLDLLPSDLMFIFICAQDDFLFLDPRAPYATSSTSRLHSASTWFLLYHFAYTSIEGLWDMGTHGSPPTRVPEVPVKRTRPARSPTDLQVGPETLSTIPATLEDLRRPYPDHRRPARLAEQAFP